MESRKDAFSLSEFLDALYSKEPVPGGGGVAALCIAMGACLCGMVSNLTVGKKKYAAYEEEMQQMIKRALFLKNKSEMMIAEDAKQFAVLREAYGLVAENEAEKEYKNQQIQQALRDALKPPMQCIYTANDVVILLEQLLEKGNTLLLSDVGVGAECICAGIKSAWLTALINLNSIDDKAWVAEVKEEMLTIVEDTTTRCKMIYRKVEEILCKPEN
ncbi:MAG: cyclodeaminase/cyclohydrolase family protein [Eubacteriaceae bacterium]|jgi:formiminotetrahydrofolate cyclodeaminase|nr:cyclodeaminase/cyclohydrolase family protein [Eubacteriaceae bacterium]